MTIFAVSEEKNRWLRERMAELGLREEDMEERFVRSSGAGGQHVNKTATCVWLRHRPTGLEVKCMAERSQSLNRFLARRELAEKLAAFNGLPTTKDDKADKLRRQKARRKRKATTKYAKPDIDRDTQDNQEKP
ncbi:peptide chain release factor-like protein [Geobacter sp. AOG1]|uniref:peptide chain release factor family protein n=1 Tax=Geobacter sp. AOG1 TaxID=1566346 RepID=UPI001CC7F837|nr:peptide chain release factor-like protein [Geobacter sp. AOG1]GFE56137.1 peptidyl-tRNA hydrolase [Geobacter sp. AOG1]